MSKSTYKRWMTEAYLYEKDAGETEITWTDPETKEKKKATAAGIIKKGEKHPAYKDAKAAMDGDDKEKKKPVSIDIDASGGLGGDDEEKPSGEKPEGEPKEKDPDHDAYDEDTFEYRGNDPKMKKLHATLKDKAGDDRVGEVATDSQRYAMEKMTKSEAEETLKAFQAERDRLRDKGTPDPAGEYYKPAFDSEEDDHAYMGAQDAVNQWYMLMNPKDQGGMFAKPQPVRWKEEGGEQGRTGTEEIKVINGKKYRAIKESVDKRISVKEVHKWLKGLEEYRYRKIPGVDARRIASFINNGLSETDLPKSLQKKWESAKYNKEKSLADRFIKQRISQKLTQTESKKHPLKEQYDRLFTDRTVL